jgi:homoserine O-acetyltransferase
MAQSGGADGLVAEKKVFELARFVTLGGRELRDLRMGFETYGRLAPAADNVILVCHYFSGSSHCAGRYRPDDAAPGYWDSLIGPGKAIDTDRFFVVSADTPCNVNAKDPMVATVGPSTLDPDTGRPYGARFPLVTIRDFVRLQKALLDALGVQRLYCVAGPSMGAMQTLEWGAQYPQMVERLLPVCGAGLRAEPYFIAEIDLWAAPILHDPHWQGGDYHGGPEPLQGLREALKVITVTARAPGWALPLYDRNWAQAGADPLADPAHVYAVEAALDLIAAERGRYADAAHLVQLVRGCRLYDVGGCGGSVRALRAPTLLVSARSDTVMYPAYTQRAAAVLRAQGTPVRTAEIDAEGGHLDCLFEIARVAPEIRAFLA